MKKINKIFMIMLSIFIIAGCTSNGDSKSNDPNISDMKEGYIFEVEANRVLVLENVSSEDFDKSWNEIYEGYQGDAIWLKISDTLDLQVGQKVQYWIDGPVADSWPQQGTAHKIEIIAERPIENSAFRNLESSGKGGEYTVTGEARVFEATMSYAVSDGHVYLLEDFHTLDEGAPEWSAFTINIDIPEEQLPFNGTLSIEVFEYSAKDGSIINLLSIPLETF